LPRRENFFSRTPNLSHKNKPKKNQNQEKREVGYKRNERKKEGCSDSQGLVIKFREKKPGSETLIHKQFASSQHSFLEYKQPLVYQNTITHKQKWSKTMKKGRKNENPRWDFKI